MGWQRGFIMKVKNPCTTDSATTKLAVYFVDSNESKWIKNSKHLRCMSNKLQELPMYSFQIFFDDPSQSGSRTKLVENLNKAKKNHQSFRVEVTNGGILTNKLRGKLLIGKSMVPVFDYDATEN